MWTTNFKDMVDEGVNYFSSLSEVESRATIVDVLRSSTPFPSFFNPEENQYLMGGVGKQELQGILKIFHKYKIRG
jgi:hypothetical protein